MNIKFLVKPSCKIWNAMNGKVPIKLCSLICRPKLLIGLLNSVWIGFPLWWLLCWPNFGERRHLVYSVPECTSRLLFRSTFSGKKDLPTIKQPLQETFSLEDE